MAKKQLTVEEYKAKNEKKEAGSKKFEEVFVKTIAVALSCVLVFCAVAIAFSLMGSLKTTTIVKEVLVGSSQTDAVNPDLYPGNSSVSEMGGADDPSDIVADTDNMSADNQGNTAYGNASENAKPSSDSVSEIVAYFNKCANKVKTDAKKVTKNYEDRTVGEIKVPDILQSMTEGLINEFFGDDTEPIVYDTRDEIKANFMVPEQDYVSKLKVSDVVKASRKDNGNTYEITIQVKDEKNPTAGRGVGSVFDVIEAHEVANKAPNMVEDFSTYYYNCVVKVTVDKATGRITHANYTTPLVLSVTVNMFGTQNASIGLTFEKDYTIEY